MGYIRFQPKRKPLFGKLLCPLLLLIFSLLPSLGSRCAGASPFALPEGFVYAVHVVPGIILDMRYYGTDNFVGGRIDFYRAPVAILTRDAANALKKANDMLGEKGYALKVFDAYRPVPAVAHFIRWSRDLSDQKMKASFYPDVDKASLFKRGYISRRSAHSRGSTVDVGLVEKANGREVDMGSSFDFFGEISHFETSLIAAQQRANRKLLRDAMLACGFRGIRTEWWHYTLNPEPFPETYFDFAVED